MTKDVIACDVDGVIRTARGKEEFHEMRFQNGTASRRNLRRVDTRAWRWRQNEP